jgi:hypothetical protein
VPYADPVRRKAYEKNRRLVLAEAIRERERQYRLAHHDEFKAKRRLHREAHREELRLASKKWYANNRDRAAAKARERRRLDPLLTRRVNLKKTHGITLEAYEVMLKRQGGKCAICGTPEVETRRALVVDHDHATGTRRSLLCGECNLGLGKFKDDYTLLVKAAEYLEGYLMRAR